MVLSLIISPAVHFYLSGKNESSDGIDLPTSQ